MRGRAYTSCRRCALRCNWIADMAIFHFSAKVIGRSSGRSAVAAAAYRAGEQLHDERIDRTHDFTNKAGVLHSEVMLPKGAPEAFGDRATLWNAVEAAEKRKDAQLCPRSRVRPAPRAVEERQHQAGARVRESRVRREGHDCRSQCALGYW